MTNLIHKILTGIYIVVIIAIICVGLFIMIGVPIALICLISPSSIGYEYTDGFANEDLEAYYESEFYKELRKDGIDYEKHSAPCIVKYQNVSNLLTISDVLFENTIIIKRCGSGQYIKINNEQQKYSDNYTVENFYDCSVIIFEGYYDNGRTRCSVDKNYSSGCNGGYIFNKFGNNLVLCKSGSLIHFMDKNGYKTDGGYHEITLLNDKIYGQLGSQKEEIIFLN